MKIKLNALKFYEKNTPSKYINTPLDLTRGAIVGLKYAEAFYIERIIK